MKLFTLVPVANVGSIKDLMPKWDDSFNTGDKLLFGLKILLIAAVLGAVIYGIISIFMALSRKKSPIEEPSVQPQPIQASQPVVDSTDENQLVAIVTAAIAASRNSSDCAFNVVSITQIKK